MKFKILKIGGEIGIIKGIKLPRQIVGKLEIGSKMRSIWTIMKNKVYNDGRRAGRTA